MGLGWGNYLISVRRRRARLQPLSLESNCGQNALVNAATWRDSARVRVARGPALTRERPWGAVIVGKRADLLSHSPKQLEPRQLSLCPHLGSHAWTGRARLSQLVSQVDPNSHTPDWPGRRVSKACVEGKVLPHPPSSLLRVPRGSADCLAASASGGPLIRVAAARSCSVRSSEVRFTQALNFRSP